MQSVPQKVAVRKDLPFPRQPPPECAPIIQRAIPKTPHAIMFRFCGRKLHLRQRHKSFLQHILRLAVTEAERATIQN